MRPNANPRLARQLERLDRQTRIMAALVGVLIAMLVIALVSFQLASGAWDIGLSAESRYHLVVSLSGLVALFSLYMLYQQRQQRALREQLLDATLREESLRSRLADLASFFERVSQDGASIELDPLMAALAEHLRATLEADHVSLMLVDPETNVLRTHAVAGSDPDEAAETRIPHGEGVAGSVLVARRSLVLDAAAIAKRFPAPHAPFRTAEAGMCVPLPVGDVAIGVLNVTRFRSRQPFTEEDARWVSVFASHTAIVLKRIGERRSAEQALREHEDQLHQAKRMEALGRLAGGVAHEFNSLLTLMLAHGRKLAAGLPAGSPAADQVGKMVVAADHCAALTRQLLAFSRKQVSALTQLDLNLVVGETAELLGRLLDPSIELRVALDPALDSVPADRAQIEQILMNLITNARDAMPEGGRITLRTEMVDLAGDDAAALHLSPGRYARIIVRDTGHGMDEETREHIFEPFFTTKPEGAGLGLSSVYGIVNQWGGVIDVISEPAQGSLFRIHLPHAMGAAAVQKPGARRAGLRGARGTILLVEDQDELRGLLRGFLEADGYRVIEAAWAGEAALLVEESSEPIDLLLTDVVMPGENGGELAQWMAARRPGISVLYMSGRAGNGGASPAADGHGTAFLQKPFTRDALLEKVAQLIGPAAAASRTTGRATDEPEAREPRAA